MSLLLASGSPRRAELLDQMGLPFERWVTDVDESVRAGEAPADYVERLAREKAEAGWRVQGTDKVASIGADTIVLLDGEILGKPSGPKESRAMLERLSGREHVVLTGIAVTNGVRTVCECVSSTVRFRSLSADEIAAYVASNEGADKAGSYGIQGIGGIFIERLIGSYSAVMGLPVLQTEALLTAIGVDTWSMRIGWPKNS